ncbi:MAG: dTDP-4-dehydrorhamnose reductase [Pseudomonadota bacterium]
MSFLAFGKTGQVARELARLPDVICLGRDEAELSDAAGCAAQIGRCRPRAVINAAAYTDVDRAESQVALARLVNGNAPGALANACAELRIPFVHLSTDYVFDGSGDAPWRPSSPTAPLNAYGESKSRGEQAVYEAGGTFAILRTSWVFAAQGKNFVRTMLRLGAEQDALRIVSDQIGGPTPARDIAKACYHIAECLIENPALSGTYHFSGTPDCSWAAFAREIFQMSDISCHVIDIKTQDYPTAARRPLNGRLDCSLTQAAFGLARPDWRVSLAQTLKELGAMP